MNLFRKPPIWIALTAAAFMVVVSLQQPVQAHSAGADIRCSRCGGPAVPNCNDAGAARHLATAIIVSKHLETHKHYSPAGVAQITKQIYDSLR